MVSTFRIWSDNCTCLTPFTAPHSFTLSPPALSHSSLKLARNIENAPFTFETKAIRPIIIITIIISPSVDILPYQAEADRWSTLSVPCDVMTKVVEEHAAHPLVRSFCLLTDEAVKVTPVGHCYWKSMCKRMRVSALVQYVQNDAEFSGASYICSAAVTEMKCWLCWLCWLRE